MEVALQPEVPALWLAGDPPSAPLGAGTAGKSIPRGEEGLRRSGPNGEEGEIGWRLGQRLSGDDKQDGNGSAFRAMDDLGRLFVVRIFARAAPATAAADEARLREDLARLQALCHPRLLQTLGYNLSPTHLYVHLEYLPAGTMAVFLEDYGPLTGRLLKQAVRDFLEGLHFLHSQQPPLVHGDVRASNILVDLKFRAKLTASAWPCISPGQAGLVAWHSLPWSAPETVQHEAKAEPSADLWSAGCTVLEMATSGPPWGQDVSLDAVLLALRGSNAPTSLVSATPPVPDHLQTDCQAFVKVCLRRSPAERMPTSELLRHPFIA